MGVRIEVPPRITSLFVAADTSAAAFNSECVTPPATKTKLRPPANVAFFELQPGALRIDCGAAAAVEVFSWPGTMGKSVVESLSFAKSFAIPFRGGVKRAELFC